MLTVQVYHSQAPDEDLPIQHYVDTKHYSYDTKVKTESFGVNGDGSDGPVRLELSGYPSRTLEVFDSLDDSVNG